MESADELLKFNILVNSKFAALWEWFFYRDVVFLEKNAESRIFAYFRQKMEVGKEQLKSKNSDRYRIFIISTVLFLFFASLRFPIFR